MDDDVIAEPATLVAAVERHPDKWSAKPQNAPQLLAAVLERQGRRDEAIELLRHVRRTSTNQIRDLADLMAKDGRESELRELVADEQRRHAGLEALDLLDGGDDRVEAAVTAARRS